MPQLAPFALRVHHPPPEAEGQKRRPDRRRPPYDGPVPLRLAIVNDYEVVVRGLADMLGPFADEVSIVEINSSLPVSQPVDIALYDTFAQSQGNGPDVADLLRSPLIGRVVVYTWNIENQFLDGTPGRRRRGVPVQDPARRRAGRRAAGGARRRTPGRPPTRATPPSSTATGRVGRRASPRARPRSSRSSPRA